MIAVPLPLAIQRYHKYVGLLQPFQHLLATTPLPDSVTQRRREASEDAGAEQKGLHVLRLSSQDLLGQVVQDVALISADLLKQSERINSLWQGKTKQLQTHQPALRAIPYLLGCLIRQLDAHHLIKEGSRLLPGTAQLVSTHF